MKSAPFSLIATIQGAYCYFKRRILRLIGLKGRTAWVSAPACYAHFVGDEHPESPKRLQSVEQLLRRSHIWARMQKVEASEVSDIQLARVHTHNYLHQLEHYTPHDGLHKVNEDTYLGKDTFVAAKHAAGAAVRAVNLVMKRHAKNAFCAIRPPGHHAHASRANGFCFINNAAVAAMHAIAEYRLERVAIIDFDLHHGDGTQSIFQDDKRVLLLSSFESPLYPFTGTEPTPDNIINTPFQAGDDGKIFRERIQAKWLPKLASFRPQLIIISAGFDAHYADYLGHLKLNEEDFAWLTQKIMLVAERYADGRVVSLLEGGYNPDSLAACVKAHLGCLVNASRFAKREM